jgi:RNA polymerase sigma-70 factor (ECF subfamily)
MSWDEGERDPADVEDADRIARVARGDLDAYRALFKRYYPRVFAFVQRRLRDPVASEDVVVEVFYELWRSAGRFRGDSRPSTFLCGIAHFKCLSAIRAQGRSKRSAVIATEQEVLDQHADETSLSTTIEGREEMRRVQAALGALPEGQREVVEMAFMDGLPYGEIAERLGVAEGTVKTRVARARAQLRRALSRERSMEEPS